MERKENRAGSNPPLRSFHLIVRWTGKDAFPVDQYAQTLNRVNSFCGGGPAAGGASEPIKFHDGWECVLDLNDEQTLERVVGALCLQFEGKMTVYRFDASKVDDIPL